MKKKPIIREYIIGTTADDFIYLRNDVTEAYGLGGRDTFICETNKDVSVDGGSGRDTFEFMSFSGQDVVFNEISTEKTVIKIFDENGDRLQKMVLNDIEQIDWAMVG